MDEQLEAVLIQQLRTNGPGASLIDDIVRTSCCDVIHLTEPALGRLLEAHTLLIGVLGRLYAQFNGKVAPTTEVLQQRSALRASFVIGMGLTEDAIAQGRYLQALALLRQEMEIVARMLELGAGKNRRGKPASIAMLDPSVARLYGELSAAVHAGCPDMLRVVTHYPAGRHEDGSEIAGTRLFPVFVKETARRCFALHLMLLRTVVEEIGRDFALTHGQARCEEEAVDAVMLAAHLMLEEGMIEAERVGEHPVGR